MPHKKTENVVTIDFVKSRAACWGENQGDRRNPAEFFYCDGKRIDERYFVGFSSKNDHRKQLFVRMLLERQVVFKDNGADVQILASAISDKKIKEFLVLLGYRFGRGDGGVGRLETPYASSDSLSEEGANQDGQPIPSV